MSVPSLLLLLRSPLPVPLAFPIPIPIPSPPNAPDFEAQSLMTATWTRYTMHDNIIYGPAWCLQLLRCCVMECLMCHASAPSSNSNSDSAARTHQQIVHLNTNCSIKGGRSFGKSVKIDMKLFMLARKLNSCFLVFPIRFMACGCDSAPDWPINIRDTFLLVC